jgi:hypothetical protein
MNKSIKDNTVENLDKILDELNDVYIDFINDIEENIDKNSNI